jgi:hypothetical protein
MINGVSPLVVGNGEGLKGPTFYFAFSRLERRCAFETSIGVDSGQCLTRDLAARQASPVSCYDALHGVRRKASGTTPAAVTYDDPPSAAIASR